VDICACFSHILNFLYGEVARLTLLVQNHKFFLQVFSLMLQILAMMYVPSPQFFLFPYASLLKHNHLNPLHINTLISPFRSFDNL